MALSSLSPINSGIYYIIAPFIAQNFFSKHTNTSFIFIYYFLGFSISNFFFSFSDFLKIKQRVFISINIYILGLLLNLISENSDLNLFCISRVLQGIGLGGTMVLSRSLQREFWNNKELDVNASFFSSLIPLFALISPFLGMVLYKYYNIFSCNSFLFITSLLVFVFISFSNDSVIGIERKNEFKFIDNLISMRKILRKDSFYILIGSFVFSIEIILYTFASTFLLNPSQYGKFLHSLSIALITMSFILGSRFSYIFNKHWDARLFFFPLLFFMSFFLFLSLLFLSFSSHTSIYFKFFYIIIVSGCTGIISPNIFSHIMKNSNKLFTFMASIYCASQFFICSITLYLIKLFNLKSRFTSICSLIFLLSSLCLLLLPRKKAVIPPLIIGFISRMSQAA